MSGQLKLLFDRIVPTLEHYELYTMSFPRPKHKGKKVAIVTASLAPFPFNQLRSQAGRALRAVRTILNAAGFDIRAQINVPLTPDPAHIGERWLSKARKLGGQWDPGRMRNACVVYHLERFGRTWQDETAPDQLCFPSDR